MDAGEQIVIIECQSRERCKKEILAGKSLETTVLVRSWVRSYPELLHVYSEMKNNECSENVFAC